MPEQTDVVQIGKKRREKKIKTKTTNKGNNLFELEQNLYSNEYKIRVSVNVKVLMQQTNWYVQ